MTLIGLTRRKALLLPLLLAACSEEAPQSFPPLRYNYLPPLGLNVARISIEQRFIPSGIPPDVTLLAPINPVDALRVMAEDRLQALGSAGRAVFSVLNASFTKRGDVIDGVMEVELDVYPSPTSERAGFTQARVVRQRTGGIDNLPAVLYEMTRAMMDSMNVEFEYQLRQRLRDWVVTATSVVPPVEQQPLAPGAGTEVAPETPPPAPGGEVPPSPPPAGGPPPPPVPLVEPAEPQ